ncbi:hypothetical protein SAMN05421740_1022 [Parapedobacter koreensis]|uniref:Uncharacterized protein n=2 Tax=Parapedobacter koreensis TaxID=332977 RepID=A0A1H7HY26_9SPHI|nr:hypothetical protein SAMN05421740_1022 [Parapedobacter koreensis]
MFYYKGKPYSGEVFDLFNNSNTISYTAKVIKGIPSGRWIAYGYNGEVVSEGRFITLDTEGGNDFSRITLERSKENEIEINKVFVVTDDPDTIKNKPKIIEKVNLLLDKQNISKDIVVEFVEYEF